jgi:hypothetical protein
MEVALDVVDNMAVVTTLVVVLVIIPLKVMIAMCVKILTIGVFMDPLLRIPGSRLVAILMFLTIVPGFRQCGCTR